METIKVFKTDVDSTSVAKSILDEIRESQSGSEPSIDLEDCDNVLRIENNISGVDERLLKEILGKYGYRLEILN